MDRAAQGERETTRAFVVSGVLAFLLMAFGALLAVSTFREWSRQQRALEQTRAQFVQAQKLEALAS
jgi:type II secretory pathway component PulJ